MADSTSSTIASLIEVVPDIEFSGFYYGEILRSIMQILRRNRDAIGITSESDYEVAIALMKAFAVVGHMNNTRLDTVASELVVSSATLLQSLKELFALIGVKLETASPGLVYLLGKLSSVTSADITDAVPEGSKFSADSTSPIIYESLEEEVDLNRTDRAEFVYGLEENRSGSDGAVDTSNPDYFSSATAAFTAADLWSVLEVPSSTQGNAGEFLITEILSATRVRVIVIPDNESPAFQTETTLAWSLKRFSKNYNVEAYTPGSTFYPFTTPGPGDAMYVGHSHCMWSKLNFDVNAGVIGITEGVWEYPDGERSIFSPNLVTIVGPTLQFNLDTLIGTVDRRGASVTVEYIPTGTKETVVSTWSGTKNQIITTGLLGQVVASTNVADYSVTCRWVPLDNQVDATGTFSGDGDVTYNFPHVANVRSWLSTEVNREEGFFLRFRYISVGAPYPVLDLINLDDGDQYMYFPVYQGETVGEKVIGSSDGNPNQYFDLPDTPYLSESEVVEVDETGAGDWAEWTRVDTLLESQSISRHYEMDVEGDGTGRVKFGDGTNGRIPPLGSNNIRAAWRVGGDIDGNVGTGQVTNNTDGLSIFSSVSNPHSATGWQLKDGGTEEAIEQLKRTGPARMTIRGTAIRPEDCESLATEWRDSQGSRPVARAFGEEEGMGPKTIKLVVVGTGGYTLSLTQKTALETYFNGKRYTYPRTTGVLAQNHELTVFNYNPRRVTIAAVVVWKGGSEERIRNALLAMMNPLKLENDGVTWVWNFNDQVSYSRVLAEIHEVDPGILDVSSLLINGVASSLSLGTNQLPKSIAADISVTIVEP